MYRIYLWNRVAAPVEAERPAPDLLEALRRHYEPDLKELAELVGPVPGVTGPASTPGSGRSARR